MQLEVAPAEGRSGDDVETLGAIGIDQFGLEGPERLVAFRYHDLILLKNQSSRGIVVRGRPLGPGAFCRVYAGQRIILGEQVLTYQDLAYYFNAKKNVALTQVYLSIDGNDEVEIEKVKNRESSLEIIFGLKQSGIGVLITDHNVRETLSVTDRAYIINEGKIFRAGTPGELGRDPEVRRIYLGDKFSMD